MAIDLAYLKSKGISSGDYKKIFSGDPAKYPTRIQQLIDTLRARNDDGYWMNLRSWRLYAAIDLACDVSFQQTTPTLVRHILSRNLSPDDTLAAVRSWGLNESELFMDVTLPDGKSAKALNAPLFYKVLVPLVMAYLIGRVARLFNERVETFLTYKPRKKVSKDKIYCEIWTDIAKTIGQDLGYAEYFKQAILQACKYGTCLTFPKEQWYREQQIENGSATIVKEGIRYVQPHPTRTFYDLAHPLSTINTNTGVEFLGHWTIIRYAEILDNRDYWNKAKIFAGTNWFNCPLAGDYFTNFFPCQLKAPFPASGAWGADGIWENRREDKLAFYTANSPGDRDKPVFLTEHYMRLKPSDWGMGSYSYPVWHRFVIAGPDTVIFAEPFAYTPAWFAGYDYDANAARNLSLGLTLIPWQDHLGNLLTNMLVTSYKNLTNLTFYNNQVVDVAQIEAMKATGYKQYMGLNLIGYDPIKLAVGRNDLDRIFQTVNFPVISIQELLQMVNTLLSIMERVEGFSAQEVGAAASHQQSVVEVKMTGGSTTNRLQFTGSFIDAANDGWKQQIVEACLQHYSPNIIVEVSENIPDLEAHLTEMGFTVLARGESWQIRGNKKNLKLVTFATSTQGSSQESDAQIAQPIFTAIQSISANPELFKKIGAKNLLKLIEQATILAGGPDDFRLEQEQAAPGSEDVEPNVIAAIQKAMQSTMQAIEQKIGQPAAQHVMQVEQEVAGLKQGYDQMAQALKALQQTQGKEAIKAQELQQSMAAEAARTQAEIQRKSLESQAEIQRRNAESQAEIQRLNLEAQADAQRKAEEVKTGIALSSVKAASDVALAHKKQAMQPVAAPQPAPGKVSESINYKDLPIEQQKQVETQAGLVPTKTRTYRENKTAKGKP